MSDNRADEAVPTLVSATRFWLKLGLISFGGPTGQIAIMHSELVEKRRWIGESQFLHALNFCMLLPGPEAQQLATYIGWRLHGVRGGVIAGGLFVLPSAMLLGILSYLYVSYGEVAWIADLFGGLKPAVLGIVAAAVVRIGSKVSRTAATWLVAGGAFSALLVGAPFPIIMLAAAGIGFVGEKCLPGAFQAKKPHSLSESVRDPAESGVIPSLACTARVVVICLALWWVPVFLAFATLGGDHPITRMGLFFSKAAMVTFGGAYSVLPYVAQQAVEAHGWIEPGQMLDGLALAETTPGPLIMVLQFVGFVGGWRDPGESLTPLAGAVLAAAMTTWVTFLPCFLWIFAAAPYVQRTAESPRLAAALSAITAAVVGVILKLAIWLGAHTLVASGRVDWPGTLIAVATFWAITRYRVDILWIVPLAALLGVFRGWVT